MSFKGKVLLLKQVPQGAPKESDFEFQDRETSIKEGEILLKTLYLSIDPYLVGKMRGTSSYTESFKVGEPISSFGYAQVVESKNPNFKVGDEVTGILEWANYTIATEKSVNKAVPGVDPEAQLGCCGLTGLTAYIGLLDLGSPKEGETVLVSGAAGATGSVVGMIAKIKGCKVVGIAGSDEKCDYLAKELGFDKTINYKKVQNLKQAIQEACPQGVDVYFDNVGGPTLDAALRNMNRFGRVVICGAISQYSNTTEAQGPRNETVILQKSLKVQGFIVSDFAAKFPTAFAELGKWYKEGKIKNRVTLQHGIENVPRALIDLLHGENTGKMLVKL